MAVTLVTGPVRSGKSRYAVALAQDCGLPVRYVATALPDPHDPEWRARLERHQSERPLSWELVESASFPHSRLLELFRNASAEECLLVDALGTWLDARIATQIEALERDFEQFQGHMDQEAAELADAMLTSPARVIVVGEEVGWDVVPVAASARLFRDVLGRMKQRLAARAQRVILVVAGISLDLTALGSRPA